MINVICAVHRPLPIWSVSEHTRDPLTPCFDGSQVKLSFFFNLEFKFLLIHNSNFHVTGFSYGSNTHDVVGRLSHSRPASDVATTIAYSWILATTSFRWTLATTTSSQPSRPEFQHFSPTFWPGILVVATVGTSNWCHTLFLCQTKYSSYACPRINCSTHTTKSVHR
jgi:hypothetical protein